MSRLPLRSISRVTARFRRPPLRITSTTLSDHPLLTVELSLSCRPLPRKRASTQPGQRRRFGPGCEAPRLPTIPRARSLAAIETNVHGWSSEHRADEAYTRCSTSARRSLEYAKAEGGMNRREGCIFLSCAELDDARRPFDPAHDFPAPDDPFDSRLMKSADFPD